MCVGNHSLFADFLFDKICSTHPGADWARAAIYCEKFVDDDTFCCLAVFLGISVSVMIILHFMDFNSVYLRHDDAS